jgi:hypothetical protein
MRSRRPVGVCIAASEINGRNQFSYKKDPIKNTAVTALSRSNHQRLKMAGAALRSRLGLPLNYDRHGAMKRSGYKPLTFSQTMALICATRPCKSASCGSANC